MARSSLGCCALAALLAAALAAASPWRGPPTAVLPGGGPLVLTEGAALEAPRAKAGRRLLVLGGAGYVGREVCRLAVSGGYEVTSLSRRGVNPEPRDERLAAVRWVKGDATSFETVSALVGENDAVVHSIGLLFDIDSGLKSLNLIVSGSKSTPDQASTYDNVTRKTAFNVIDAVRQRPVGATSVPVLFVSAAEAGWPEVKFGPQVERLAPQWLKRYLAAKRAVEAELQGAAGAGAVRPVVFRPSLVWSWSKLDVLPAIPIFNFASALGLPFVDKAVRVTTLARAIVAGLQDGGISGVQRWPEMERLAERWRPARR